MKKVKTSMLLMAAIALMAGCSSEEDWTDEWDYYSDTSGTPGSSAGSTTVTGDVTTFDIALDDSDLNETETVPSDDNDYVENSTFSKQIAINFSGTTATCTGSVDGVTVSTSGADVVVDAQTEGLAISVSGTTSDGSLKIYSTKKLLLNLQGATITNPTGAAINIQSKKRIFVVLAEGTTTTLTDGTTYTDITEGEDMKACFFSEGQLCFSGKGRLNVYANCQAGIRSDDYIMTRPGVNIYVKATAGNGIKGNDAIIVRGGVINIEVSALAAKALSTDGYALICGGRTTCITTGNATLDEDNELTASAGLKADSTLTVSGGQLLLKSTGNGAKGISTDQQAFFTGGEVAVITTGKTFTYGRDDAKAKGIKADGDIRISGGSLKVRATGSDGSEAIESKGEITIEGGEIQAYSYDDAINSKGNLYLNSGLVYACSSGNDAIDANKNLYISGGTTIALGAGQPENALDAAEGYSIVISGGNVFGLGGSTAQTASSSSQASVAYQASVGGKTIGLFDASGNGLMAMQVPASSLNAVYMTVQGMTAGQTYTLKSGVSVSGGTTWNGISTTGTISGGTTLATATSASQVGQGMGGGMNPGGRR